MKDEIAALSISSVVRRSGKILVELDRPGDERQKIAGVIEER
jgi:hypothetical protein